MDENVARTSMNVERPSNSIRERIMASGGVSGNANSALSNDLIKKELRELRQDINIVAQHIVAIRKEMSDKMQTMSDTANVFEEATRNVFNSVIQKISDGELDTFSEALNQIIKDDNETNRKQLYEDIERIIITQSSKQSQLKTSLMQKFINVLLIGSVIALFLILQYKG